MHERLWLCQLIDVCMEHYPKGIPVLFNVHDFTGSHHGYLHHSGGELFILQNHKSIKLVDIKVDSNFNVYLPGTNTMKGTWL